MTTQIAKWGNSLGLRLPKSVAETAQIEEGDRKKLDVLFSLVYPKLRSLAAKLLTRERRGNSIEPNMLVHEVYLKLVHQQHATWKTKSHFFAVGAEAMRRILVDSARRKA
jgi:RNA polymerase sigma factor (TIGR02999 family)